MDAIIVGAGIAGLTAAHRLKQQGREVLLLEQSGHCGGCLESFRSNGFLLEKGPNSFLGNAETILEHVTRLGLQDQVIEAKESARNRYVYQGGRLQAFPKSPGEFLRTALLSPRGKLRILLAPFIPTKTKGEEETVAQFITRKLGREALKLVEPMIGGVYAGDAKQWSMDGLRQARLFSGGNRIYSFKNGMQTLAHALFQTIQNNCEFECQNLAVTQQKGEWKVSWVRGKEGHEATARSLLLATPPHKSAELLTPIDPELAGILYSIPFAPLAILHVVVKRSSLNRELDGFGWLSGTTEPHFLLGTLWSSASFSNRCEDPDSAILTCFAGGAKNPVVLQHSDPELTAKTITELREVFGPTLYVKNVFITRRPKGLPQYILGHAKKIAAIRNRSAKIKNIHLVGNYLDGVSVNDTMQNTVREAERLC